jgi:hypothetical protein
MPRYNIGTTKKVSIKELERPPMRAQAIPFFHSAPAPFERAIGNIQIIIASEVMITGLNLSFTDSVTASRADNDCC